MHQSTRGGGGEGRNRVYTKLAKGGRRAGLALLALFFVGGGDCATVLKGKRSSFGVDGMGNRKEVHSTRERNQLKQLHSLVSGVGGKNITLAAAINGGKEKSYLAKERDRRCQIS